MEHEQPDDEGVDDEPDGGHAPPERPSEGRRTGLTRRTVLRGAGAGVMAVLFDTGLVRGLTSDLFSLPYPKRFDTVVEVLRPDDFLRLRFLLDNLGLDPAAPPGQPRLVRLNPTGRAFVVVEFPSQHQVEKSLLEANNQLIDPIPQPLTGVPVRMARESRLAFEVPDTVTSIPFTLDALLDWAAWTPSLVKVANPTFKIFKANPRPTAPSAVQTAIELPWWLLLSPSIEGAWAHSAVPVTRNGRTELWHTRLGRRGGQGVDETRPDGVRAVWARDPGLRNHLDGLTTPGDDNTSASPAAVTGLPFRMPYTPKNRVDAILASADWSNYSPFTVPSGYRPEPFKVDRLMLTALGAWADLDGVWNPPQGVSLVGWRHRVTGGRDQAVRILNRGRLHPFGHQALKVRLTERRLDPGNGRRGAYLFSRVFFLITEPVRDYPGAVGVPNGGRTSPFQRLEVISRVSPDAGDQLQVGDPFATQPLVSPGGPPIELTFAGTDWEGRRSTFSAPFVFVEDQSPSPQQPSLPFDAVRMANVNAAYAALQPDHRRARFGGQPVAFAPSSSPGNTTLQIEQMAFGVLDAIETSSDLLLGAGQIFAFPALDVADVRLPVTEQLAGLDQLASQVAFVDDYLQHGFDELLNAGEAFLEFVSPTPLDFDVGKAGGLVNPSSPLTAITRPLGPVGGLLPDIVGDRFDPEQVFQDGIGNILGGVPLKEIVTLVDGVKNDLDQALRYVEERLPDEVIVRFRWKPKLKQDPLGIFVPRTIDPKTTALFEGEARQSVADPNRRSARAFGEITNFRLQLLTASARFIEVDISKVTFKAASGQKTEIDVKVDKVTFVGPLEFVEALRGFLERAGDDLASVPVPQAIVASTGFEIPSVQLGVFSLSNLFFGAKLTIPLTGDPVRLRFRFSSREDPFLLQVGLFGGGGWFAIALGADGMEQLEIGFEFGGAVAINIGIASGGIALVAGVYLKIEKQQNGDEVVLEGYVRLHGELEVLGIVSVSITLELGLRYLHKPGPPALDIVTGRAKCTIKVQILFFSISVGFEVEKSFGGDPSDPTFADQLTAGDWSEYAAAFAPVV